MLMSDIEIFLKRKKKKGSHNVVVNDIKIFQKMKNKGQSSVSKVNL